ncbi:hypothetical protein TRFO_38643 [Tritrichomonas foetus]|uniref:F5/8 type C domain-containing protein n=1 Tax=Tritrichomonas foetus TaxID=1144522 RepID=A0A1J4JCJ0_9EUKA|nr:hypothetical protein TRFO_38643 [Tritrichomonas foetus]|eukprot:OHS95125.1 hypothetical protein TRFO_38643 [Tritrichomonas foetus]
MSFSLSSDFLTRVNFDIYDKDFTFIVNEQCYKVNKICADIISPIINNIHKTDPTVDHFDITCEFDSSEFEHIIGLFKNQPIEINKINTKQMMHFFNELGNSEFLSFLLGNCESLESCSQEKVIERFLIKLKHSINVDEDVEFIANHFYQFEENLSSDLDVDSLSIILSHPSLQIPNEEWLFNLIMNNIQRNPLFISLLEFVEFRNLSTESMFHFAQQIPFEELNISIWKSICKRLSCEIVNSSFESRSASLLSFEYTDGNPLKGIISFLNDQFGGNVANKQIIDVTADSPINDDEQFSPTNVVDLDTDTRFYSKDYPNQSITFDFKDMRIIPTFYSIRTQGCGINCCHMKSWVVEQSDDGIEWTEVDRQENSNELNGSFKVGTFEIKDPMKSQFIRIRQTGMNWYNDNRMFLCGVEFFGDLYNF